MTDETGNTPAKRAPRKRGTARAGATAGRSSNGGLSAAQAADLERRDEICYALKLSGEYSLERIAQYPDPERPGETLYSHRSNAAAGWRRARERHATGDVKMSERRELYEARYETLLRVVWADAIRGGRGYLFAVDRATVILRELRQMLGVDEPTRVDLNVTAGTDFDREYRALHDEMMARGGAAPVPPERPRQVEGPAPE